MVCFEVGSEAHAFGEMLRERLGKFGLRLSDKKSRIIEFGRSVWQKVRQDGGKVETFDFLGFTHYCDKTKRGKFKLGRKTASKKFRAKVKALNEWLRSVRNMVKLQDWWEVLKLKVVGHYRYYGISGNFQWIRNTTFWL